MLLPDDLDHPWRLLLLVVVVAIATGQLVAALRRRSVQRAWSQDAMQASAAPRSPGWNRHLPPALLVLALVAMTTAFAGPREVTEVQRERATVMVALDTSSSMLATDVRPDRFTAAKAAATRFVQDLPEGFDVGLVSFNATATLQVPPTADRAAVVRAIGNLELSGGTALGDALDSSLSALQTPGTDPVGAVVVLADGGSTTGSPLPAAVQRAVDAEVPVSTIAYGTPDGVVRADGRVFQVPVDTRTLADIAGATGGTAATAATAGELSLAYDRIGRRLSTATERLDVSAPFAGLGLLLLLGAAVPGLLRR